MNGRTYWKCVLSDKFKCKARFLTTGSIMKVSATSSIQHNHQPDEINYEGLSFASVKICITKQ